MSRKGYTGEQRVDFLPGTTLSMTAPSLAAMAGAIPLTGQMRRDGFSRPRAASRIDASDAASRKGKSVPGNSDAGELTFPGLRDSVTGSDVAFTTLAPDTAGVFIVRDFGGAGVAFAVGQKVDVFKGVVRTREKQPTSPDGVQNFVAMFDYEDDGEEVAIVV